MEQRNENYRMKGVPQSVRVNRMPGRMGTRVHVGAMPGGKSGLNKKTAGRLHIR